MTIRSRRRFLKVVASGAAVAIVAPAATLARAATRPARSRPAPAPHLSARPAPRPPTGVATEIAKQKKQVAQTLQTLRAFQLGNGAEQSFAFRPLRPVRGRR